MLAPERASANSLIGIVDKKSM